MKRRIQVDTIILFLIVILTGIFYQFKDLYTKNIFLDDGLDFIGFQTILGGVFLRMSARGHKKARSDKGQELVTTGPYGLVRNPMYLGSFLIGTGFILIGWPWFLVWIFLYLFAMRFNRQMKKEEGYLHKNFGKTYEAYVENVPKFFPRWSDLKKMRFTEAFPLSDIWNTPEKIGLILFPLLAFGVELVRERVAFGAVDVERTASIFVLSTIVFWGVIWGCSIGTSRNRNNGQNSA